MLNTASLEPEEDGFEYDNFLAVPQKKTEYAQLLSKKLIEFEDIEFKRITGQPQPFRAYDDEKFSSLVASVAEHGIIEPIIVRPLTDSTYQILSGRNRNRAAKVNKQRTVPCIIKNVDDTEAALIMIETNLQQRHDLLYSEKAWAYRMERDLRAHRGKGMDAGDTLEEIGKKKGDSRRTVAYLIRLTYLLPPLLDMVDNGRLAFMVGVQLSYVCTEAQAYISDAIIPEYGKIKLGQAKALQKLTDPTHEQIEEVFKAREKNHTSVTVKCSELAKVLGYQPEKDEVLRLFKEFLANVKANQPS